MVAINAADITTTKKFIKSLIQDERYEESEFLRQTSTLPFKELQRALTMINEELQQDLTILVNNEFEGFVKLFNDIGDIGEEEFMIFKDKVDIISGMVQGIHQSAEKEAIMLERLISKYRANLSEQRQLRLLSRLNKDLLRLEQLTNAQFGDSVDLELSVECFLKLRNLFNLAIGKIKVPAWMTIKFTDLFSKYTNLLDDSLLLCLKKRDAASWHSLVTIYYRIEKSQPLIEAFINEIWQPLYLSQIINKTHYEELSKKAAPGQISVTMFNQLLEAIKAVKAYWFAQLEHDDSLFVEAVLVPTFRKIIHELCAIFSPALPDSFHANYTVSSEFIKQLTLLVDKSGLYALNTSDAFQSYEKTWQLNVYYQLRFRDVAQKLEDALNSTTFPNVILQKDNPKIKSLAILEEICQDLGSERIILKPLESRFYRLKIQSMGRYGKWLVESFTANETLPCRWYCIVTYESLLKLGDRFVRALKFSPSLPSKQLEDFKALSERFLGHLQNEHLQLKEKFACFFRESLIKRAESFSIALNSLLAEELLVLLKGDLNFIDNSYVYYNETWKEICLAFIEKSKGLIVQSKKAVTNYRRLKSIMKESVDFKDESDNKITEQEVLFKVIRSQVEHLQQIVKSIISSQSISTGHELDEKKKGGEKKGQEIQETQDTNRLLTELVQGLV